MSAPMTGAPALDAVNAALATVQDPEINRPLPELGMVKDVQIGEAGAVRVDVYLTVSGCPMRETITSRVTEAVSAVPGVTSVQVGLDVMNDEQRAELRKTVRGTDAPEPVIPFAQPGSLTRVYAVASGKGGVGKSSVTVNLAAAMAAKGMSVGVVDADISGHSIPRTPARTTPPPHVAREGHGRRRGRRRHLRALDPADAGHHHAAHQGRRHDHAAAGARREGHLDRDVHAGQRRGGLARPDAAPRAAAVPRRRV